MVVVAVIALLVSAAAPVARAAGPTTSSPVSSASATTFAGHPRVPSSAFDQVAEQSRVPVVVSLAQGSQDLAAHPSQASTAVATAQAVGRHLAGTLPAGHARGTRNLDHLGMLTATVDATGLAALARSPDVAAVTVAQWRKPDLAPEDAATDAPGAWSYGTGFNGADQAVAIVDTGVQSSHPFFGGRVVDGACFGTNGSFSDGSVASNCPGGATAVPADGISPGSPDVSQPCTSLPDECSHGTHVAGIAAGGTGSTAGNGSGVAWGAGIVAVDVFSTITSVSDCAPDPSPCLGALDSDVLAGLNWVLARQSADHIVAANLSLGSGNSQTVCDTDTAQDVYHGTFATMRTAGVAPVVAAGNGYAPTTAGGFPNGIAYPACDSNAISVGAVTDAGTWTGTSAECSAIGGLPGCSFSQDAPFLSLVAPGWGVTSSVPTDAYAAKSGTSMAAPFVTGAYAVLAQQHPGWTVSDIEAVLRGTGLPIADHRSGTFGEATPSLDVGAAVDPPTFHAITPGRLLDTRGVSGLPDAFPRLGAGTIDDLEVLGSYGVPTSGVSAVVLDVTAVDPVGNGYLTVWPTGIPQPATSNLNLTPGVTKPNLVTVKVGANGAVSVFNQTGSTDLVVDIAGWYDAGGSTVSGATLHPLTPQRVLDTRDGTGIGTPGPVAGGATLQLPVRTIASLPASATAVVLNLTSVDTTVAGYVTAYPAGSSRPVASVLNPEPGQVDANLVVVPLGTGGAINLYNAGGPIDLVADLAGWYDNTSDPIPTTGHLVPLTPSRLLDTRSAIGVPTTTPVGPGGVVTLQVTGRGGVPSTGVSAVVLNLTAVDNTTFTYITAWPDGAGRPTTSNLNPIPGRITSNQVVVPVGSGGKVQLYNFQGSTDLVADVFGWYS